MGKPRRLRERRGPAFAIAVPLVKPVLLLLTRRHWVDGVLAPASSSATAASNAFAASALCRCTGIWPE